MGKVIASITVSLDGYVTGPDDGPGNGLGVGGERLHYWVMGGPWTYEGDHDTGGMTGADREYYDSLLAEHRRAASAVAACTTPPARGAARTRSRARSSC